MNMFGSTPVPRRDPEREKQGSVVGEVTKRKWTDEERERMMNLPPVTDKYGVKKTAPTQIGMPRKVR